MHFGCKWHTQEQILRLREADRIPGRGIEVAGGGLENLLCGGSRRHLTRYAALVSAGWELTVPEHIAIYRATIAIQTDRS